MTPVDIINDEYKSIFNFLNNEGQPSLSSDVNKHFKKIILLSSASYFEHKIQEILIEFVSNKSNNNSMAVNLFKKKAISMQYHSYFSWGEKNNPDKPGKNANQFFALFGDDFKKEVEEEIKIKSELEQSVKAFLEIGHLRNIMVHSNFAAYYIDNKTAEEIFELYGKAIPFITYISEKLNGPTQDILFLE